MLLCLPALDACASAPLETATAFAPGTVTMLRSGDVLIHPPLVDRAREDVQAKSVNPVAVNEVLVIAG